MTFAQPQAVGSFLKPADLNGHLILVTKVHEAFERYDDLAKKEKLNVRFNYVDLDGDQQLVEDAISSHPGIALRLKGAISSGDQVLGRIGQEPSKKAGFNPAWVLAAFTEGVDDVKASQWLAAHAQATVTQPTQVAQQAPAPVAAPAAAPAAQTIPQSAADTMRANGIQIPPGVQVVPG